MTEVLQRRRSRLSEASSSVYDSGLGDCSFHSPIMEASEGPGMLTPFSDGWPKVDVLTTARAHPSCIPTAAKMFRPYYLILLFSQQISVELPVVNIRANMRR